MRRTLILHAFLGLLLAFVVGACKDDESTPAADTGGADGAGDAQDDTTVADTGAPDTGTPDTGTPDTGTPDTGPVDTGAPDVPEEVVEPTVVQVDRNGRPAISTALISDENKDAYNEAIDPDTWDDFIDDIVAHLLVYDSLDAPTGCPGDAECGDFLTADTDPTGALFAGIVADDRLTIDVSQPDCDLYLAVELGAPGCGGRTLTRDVIDDSISALVGEELGDGAGPDGAFLDDFPFIGVPNTGQVDRNGRAGVNTVLISSENKDAYNRALTLSDWAGFAADIAANILAVDALDGTEGNFLLGDEALVAGALVDDRLRVNTANAGPCLVYLGVELDDLAIFPNDDCGGRTLEMDVIDTTLGALVGPGVSDGVGPECVAENVPPGCEPGFDEPFLADFPFLGPAN